MSSTASNTVSTRASVPTETRYAGIIDSYASQNLLGGTIPFIRGRRFVTCESMSDAYDIFSVGSSSGGGK